MESACFIPAIWRNGVFEPLEKPDLREGAKVELAFTETGSKQTPDGPPLASTVCEGPGMDAPFMDAPFQIPLPPDRVPVKAKTVDRLPTPDLSDFDE